MSNTTEEIKEFFDGVMSAFREAGEIPRHYTVTLQFDRTSLGRAVLASHKVVKIETWRREYPGAAIPWFVAPIETEFKVTVIAGAQAGSDEIKIRLLHELLSIAYPHTSRKELKSITESFWWAYKEGKWFRH